MFNSTWFYPTYGTWDVSHHLTCWPLTPHLHMLSESKNARELAIGLHPCIILKAAWIWVYIAEPALFTYSYTGIVIDITKEDESTKPIIYCIKDLCLQLYPGNKQALLWISDNRYCYCWTITFKKRSPSYWWPAANSILSQKSVQCAEK